MHGVWWAWMEAGTEGQGLPSGSSAPRWDRPQHPPKRLTMGHECLPALGPTLGISSRTLRGYMRC